MKPILTRIDYHICKTLSDLRTTELFSIIVNYSETLPALIDLKVRHNNNYRRAAGCSLLTVPNLAGVHCQG